MTGPKPELKPKRESGMPRRSDILNQKASVSPRIRDEWPLAWKKLQIPNTNTLAPDVRSPEMMLQKALRQSSEQVTMIFPAGPFMLVL